MINMNLKKVFETKPVQIITASAAINLALIFIIFKSFDIITTVAYLFFAVIIAKVATSKSKVSPWGFFFIGALIPITYNTAWNLLGVFSVSFGFIALAALQQGAVTFITSKIWGYRK